MAAVTPWRELILLGAFTLAACGQAASGDEAPTAAAEASPPAPATMVSRTEPPESPDRPKMSLPVDPTDPAECHAPEAAVFADRRADAAVRAELAAAVAPTTDIRWVGPGDATTEDFSPDRLNVMLDVAGTIVAAHCG